MIKITNNNRGSINVETKMIINKGEGLAANCPSVIEAYLDNNINKTVGNNKG